jgi:uncharacterized protein (TIGR00369 family)
MEKQDSGFAIKIPFVEHLGFRLTRFEGGESEIRFEARPEHENTFAVTHGGVVMTLLDVSMATAARSIEPDMGVVTIEMKTSFMRPTRGLVTAKGRIMHRTTSLAFTESTIFDAKGNACAHATGTFKYVRRADRVVSDQGATSQISTD